MHFFFSGLLNNDTAQRFKFSKMNAYVASSILIIFIFASASLVRVSRGAYEDYIGTSRQLKLLNGNFVLSPSMYLYLSSDVGVLSKYLELDEEHTSYGKNTFFTFYDLIARWEREKEPAFFQKGYYVPMWTNTGTYIRELDADYGITGVLLGPYLLGLICTWLWFKLLKEKKLIVLAVLVYLYIIIGFSFEMIVTRLNQWFFGLALIIMYLPVLERLSLRNKTVISLKE